MNWRRRASPWPLAEPAAVEGLQVHQPTEVSVPIWYFVCSVRRHIHTDLNAAISGTSHNETTTAEALRSVVTCLHKTLHSPDEHCGSRRQSIRDYQNSLLAPTGLISHPHFCSKWIIFHKDSRTISRAAGTSRFCPFPHPLWNTGESVSPYAQGWAKPKPVPEKCLSKLEVVVTDPTPPQFVPLLSDRVFFIVHHLVHLAWCN